MKKCIVFLLLSAFIFSCSDDDENPLTPDEILAEKQELGRLLFFDSSLSEPAGQSCATCHAPETGYSDVEHRIVSEGAGKGLFGSRNAPTVTYTSFIPEFHYDNNLQSYVGGQFWDGRASNLRIQAGGPPLDKLEMGNTNQASYVAKMKETAYYDRYTRIYGKNNTVEQDFNNMADAIAEFESTSTFNSFSSKFDKYLEGRINLTPEELKGLDLFQSKAKCTNCHPLTDDPVAKKPLLTNYTYHNVGLPKNPENPHYTMPTRYNPFGNGYIDPGLGATVRDASQIGKFKTPTLRNVAKTAPYGHNGCFKNMKDMVHFTNIRDEAIIAKSEYPATVNNNFGKLGLTEDEENAIVTFLYTLTDR